MINRIFILNNEHEFSITKAKKTFVKDWIMFILVALILYLCIFFIYYYVRSFFHVGYFIGFSITFFAGYYYLNRKQVRASGIKIVRTGNSKFCVNGNGRFDGNAKKSLVLYRFAGEPLIRAIGNLALKVDNQEYMVYYSVYESEMEEIERQLEVFLGEPIVFEKINLY